MSMDGILKKKCTDEITPSQFAAHGRVEMFFDGDILNYEASGPFNRELFESLALAQLEFLSTSSHDGPWASICLVSTSMLTSPEGLARYEEMIRAPKPDRFTPVATAFVVPPEVEGGKLMQPLLSAIFVRVGRPFRWFENMAQAKAWVGVQIEAARAGLRSP